MLLLVGPLLLHALWCVAEVVRVLHPHLLTTGASSSSTYSGCITELHAMGLMLAVGVLDVANATAAVVAC